MPPEGNHTGERVAPKVRQEIVKLLAQEKSANHIAKKLYVSRHTVGAIKEIEAQSIAQRKQTLTNSFLRIAEAGAEQIEEQLAEGKISANLLVPVTGMATDKILALSGDPSMIIRHEHDHRHIHVDLAQDFDGFLSELPASNHEAKALPVLELEEADTCAPEEREGYPISKTETQPSPYYGQVPDSIDPYPWPDTDTPKSNQNTPGNTPGNTSPTSDTEK